MQAILGIILSAILSENFILVFQCSAVILSSFG